jgi:hypothetical protein
LALPKAYYENTDRKYFLILANLQGANPTSDDNIMVISITIGCILVLLLIAGLLFHLFRRKKRRAANNPGTVNDDGNNRSGSLGEGTPSLDKAQDRDDEVEQLVGNTATEHTDYEPQEPR